ncbi:Lrp/AsnC family transcriptional regulator [Ideonella margarita]|uniref:Lrp/AsnC family transcriptional regulator n=1 Tax=Ideonella margarita TaxID=2984191 RepID=A0ABU9C3K4_9BURK
MSDQPTLDRYSLHILTELQRDSRQTVQQLADAVGLSPTPCWNRIKEMEAAGVIKGYTALVDREKVGLNLAVIVEANLSQHSEELVRRFEEAVATSPQIVRCLSTTGQADYIMTVLVADIKAYEQFLHDTIFKLPGVTHVRSSIVLRELKAEVRLPVPPASPHAAPLRVARKRAKG